MTYSHSRRRTGYKPKPFNGPTKAGIFKSKRDGWLKVVAPYSADFLDELKSVVQPSHRSFDWDGKFWLINEIYLEDLIIMCKRYFNEVETDLLSEEVKPDNLFAEVFNLIPKDCQDKVYFALAQALHPDHGGTDEIMSKLNQAYEGAK